MANLPCSSTFKTLQKGNRKIVLDGYRLIANVSQLALIIPLMRLIPTLSLGFPCILQKGNKVHLPNLNGRIPSSTFLPSQIALKISTASSNDLQKLFPELFASPATKQAIETSISYCNGSTLKGEIKSCTKSLEDIIKFSKKVGEKQLIALTSDSTKGLEKELEIGKVEQLDAEKIVTYHEIFFPFATYFCNLISSTRLYAVDFVEPTTKAPLNRKILPICHMDTSDWPVEHVAFKILKLSPGRRGEAGMPLVHTN